MLCIVLINIISSYVIYLKALSGVSIYIGSFNNWYFVNSFISALNNQYVLKICNNPKVSLNLNF